LILLDLLFSLKQNQGPCRYSYPKRY